ncbi:flavin reductase [Pseudonocardia humida]|uniref:Flavin reductase n=1 Tax=Pseudonocardia humida TaxID=2800819 RepID=A0ABT0ZS93_9PSEU|nr:flavin reductase [Pseudonocardia humida]MCO1653584.1 flavin reductase [Pseudonocardia humida]
MRAVDPAALAPQQRHRLLAGLARPHTVAVISTADADGAPLVAPLGYCLPMRGQRATVGITLAAVRDAGGEPEHVRAAALARGELVAHLTSTDLAGHLVALAAAERDATGAVRWTAVQSHRVGVPSLATGRARLECRVHGPTGPPGAPGAPAVRTSAPAASTSPTDYVLLAEVVCVVAEDDELAAMGELAPVAPRARPVPGTVFPWFLGPTDGSVVDGGAAMPGRAGAGPLVIDGSTGPPTGDGPVTRR